MREKKKFKYHFVVFDIQDSMKHNSFMVRLSRSETGDVSEEGRNCEKHFRVSGQSKILPNLF